MLAIWVKVKINATLRDKFLEAIEADALASEREEPGCLRFNVFQDEKDENVYYLFEVYKDQAALEAHCKTPHYALWRGVADVLEGALVPTFTATAIRRLGGIRWQWLRRLAYAIGLWPTEPIRCRPVFPATSAYWGLVPDDRQGDLWVSRSVGSRAAAATEAPGTYPSPSSFTDFLKESSGSK